MNAPVRKKNPRRFYAYPINFVGADVLAVSGGVGSQTINGTPDQITVFTHIGIVSTGAFLMQLTPSDLGGGMFYGPISSETMLSLMDRPGLFPIPIVLRGSETLRVDLTNDYGALTNAVRLSFIGYREFPQSPAGCGR